MVSASDANPVRDCIVLFKSPAAITSTVTPANADQSVTWTSSDAKLAKVDETGKVTGVKAGTATITATTANGKTATCAVTVADAYTIALNKTELTLVEKATETLTATVKQGSSTITNQTVTWTSSDSAVATVSNSGKVTAQKGSGRSEDRIESQDLQHGYRYICSRSECEFPVQCEVPKYRA